jgi:CheY-like chemotaxis protein
MIDPGHLEQVLVNLAVNARDAMEDGGVLTIRTSVQLSAPPGTHASMPRGAHVRILVRDSGAGMDAHTLARATEPFFTTKPSGKGTGLGLATVKDIVEQSGGALWLESAAGTGTSVWMALPLSGRGATTAASPAAVTGPPRAGTVLLVEDESGVRQITQRILEDAGFVVHLASDGEEGLRRWRECVQQQRITIDCVITDVVMPTMSGRAMVRAMRAVDGDLPVLFVSGYVEGGLSDGELGGRTAYLAKPFTPDALLTEIAGLLGRA